MLNLYIVPQITSAPQIETMINSDQILMIQPEDKESTNITFFNGQSIVIAVKFEEFKAFLSQRASVTAYKVVDTKPQEDMDRVMRASLMEKTLEETAASIGLNRKNRATKKG